MAPKTDILKLERASIAVTRLPPDSYLVHATNCLGEWGAGFVLELRRTYPGAYLQYHAYCDSSKTNAEARFASRELVGQCYIIPPQDDDVAAGAPSTFIVCIFTSHGYGRPNKAKGKPDLDRPALVLSQTKDALNSLRHQLDEITDQGNFDIYSSMFNSGAFKVPWDKTSAIIRSCFSGWHGRWIVVEPPRPNKSSFFEPTAKLSQKTA